MRNWIILLIVLVAVVAFVAVYTLRISEKTGNEKAGNESIRLVVLVDNNPYKQGLKTAWGLSVYVETGTTRFPHLSQVNSQPHSLQITSFAYSLRL